MLETLTVDEVQSLIEYDIDGDWYDFDDNDSRDISGIGTVECIEEERVNDDRWLILKATDGTTVRYFRKDGYYSSYDSSDWDGDFYEVTPRKKTVTVYETV